MKVSLWVSPIVSAVVLFGSVGVAAITGDWVTGGRDQVVQGARMNVDDIKGWMTLQQAADGMGIPVATMIGLIGAPEAAGLAPSAAFKDVESLVPGFDLASFRDRLRGYLAGDPVALPTSGASASRR